MESLKDICGTKYDAFKNFEHKYKNDGIIWYFDIYSASNEDILRTLWQFKTMHYFKYCNCIIIGRLYEEQSYTGLTLEDVINEELSDLNIPIITSFDLGHTKPVLTLINGSVLEITKNDNQYLLKISEE